MKLAVVGDPAVVSIEWPAPRFKGKSRPLRSEISRLWDACQMFMYLDPKVAKHPVTQAYASWLDYSIQVGGLRTTTYTTYETLRLLPDLLNGKAALDSETYNNLLGVTKRENDSGFITFHALYIVGLWGAFEAFVDDCCRGLISVSPQLLKTDPFKNISISAADLDKGADAINAEIFRQLRAGKSVREGIDDKGKFKILLKAVGIRVDAPDQLSAAVWEAQHVRNLWAHKAGKADEEFLKNCPSLGIPLGDHVAIKQQMAEKYALALTGYVHLVFNRFLVSEGYTPLKMSGLGMFQVEFDQLFPDAVTSHLTGQ